jgi:hypothetical protein
MQRCTSSRQAALGRQRAITANTTTPVMLLVPVELLPSRNAEKRPSGQSMLTVASNVVMSKTFWRAAHMIVLLAAGCV